MAIGQEMKGFVDSVTSVVWNTWVFVVCRLFGVSDVVNRVTTDNNIVRWSRGYVSFVFNQAMLRLIVHRERMGWFWIQRLAITVWSKWDKWSPKGRDLS